MRAAGTAVLKPSENFLLAGKHIASLIAEGSYDLIARLGKPGHAIGAASVFLLVNAFTTPIENSRPVLLPVAQSVPMAGFIGTHVLIRTKARVSPEFRNFVEARINAGSNTLAFRVAC